MRPLIGNSHGRLDRTKRGQVGRPESERAALLSIVLTVTDASRSRPESHVPMAGNRWLVGTLSMAMEGHLRGRAFVWG